MTVRGSIFRCRLVVTFRLPLTLVEAHLRRPASLPSLTRSKDQCEDRPRKRSQTTEVRTPIQFIRRHAERLDPA
jgi:hypothetical protein